jgi:hypothetical protein
VCRVAARAAAGLGARNLLDQFAEGAADTVQTLTLSQSPSIAPCDDDRIRALGQTAPFDGKGLTEQALHSVAFDRTADLARHGQPEPGRALLLTAREHVQDELSSRV